MALVAPLFQNAPAYCLKSIVSMAATANAITSSPEKKYLFYNDP